MILIIEDESVSRRALATLLTASGYATAAVPTAEDALNLLEGGMIPEIALVDVDLPGMNGFEFIERLERTNPTVYPVIVSATTGERIEDFRDKHDINCLRKPLDFDQLLSLIDHNQRRN